jgi:hypothetical protein
MSQWLGRTKRKSLLSALEKMKEGNNFCNVAITLLEKIEL